MAMIMFNSILVVCTGNICRSPIGERYLQKALPDKTIHSAGVGALVGHDADKSAFSVAKQHDLSLEGHIAQQFTSSLARKYDLILVMDRYHLEKVARISPESRGKTMLFGHWLNQKEIPDPYQKSDEAFLMVYRLIEQAGQKWVEKLNA
ncbi:TPA: protein tyrosine phosphatase [Klebsiella quasipneumoniae subsp. quasipneumoniae]|nr:protein tyrosine phosphatase [Klebsiella quasipneumoniae subsp. quasipneumoniae]HBU5899548.1 protein tyrosine phosphatase [Klebsiella quasipneumoniae subsp. quasipneumoniae]HCI4587655.1 protein tyrosine phosphatase [Klebsiella quasipneumoniae subsp. quasipneumoniae]